MWYDAYANKFPVGEMDWDPEFEQTPMVEQLGKVIDSVGNPKPIEWVITDDGYQVSLTGEEARIILQSIQLVSVQKRVDYLRRLQNSKALCDAINRIRRA